MQGGCSKKVGNFHIAVGRFRRITSVGTERTGHLLHLCVRRSFSHFLLAGTIPLRRYHHDGRGQHGFAEARGI